MVQKINFMLNQYLVWAIYAILVVGLVNGCNGCGANRENGRLRKEVTALQAEVDSLKDNTYSKEELDTRMAIEGYNISNRMLYDQNSIVRTTTRPDDRMAEYKLKLDELREKLNKMK